MNATGDTATGSTGGSATPADTVAPAASAGSPPTVPDSTGVGNPETAESVVSDGAPDDIAPGSGDRLDAAGAEEDGIPLAPVDPAVVAVPLFTD
ncbi:MAG TPA: hypothetical protein ENI86_15430 [Acidimicrobiales bacterium]|nr:hypothetical protein [Acidimicrobiales bacterium]